jgi:hypothetical protein
MTDPNDRTTANFFFSYKRKILSEIDRVFKTREQLNKCTIQRPNIFLYNRYYRWLYDWLTDVDREYINQDHRIVINFKVIINSLDETVKWHRFFYHILFRELEKQSELCDTLYIQNRIVSLNNPNRAWNYFITRTNIRPRTRPQHIQTNYKLWEKSKRNLQNLELITTTIRQNGQLEESFNIAGSGKLIDLIEDLFNEIENQDEKYQLILQFGLKLKSNTNIFEITNLLQNNLLTIQIPCIPNSTNEEEEEEDNNNDNNDVEENQKKQKKRRQTILKKRPGNKKIWFLVTPEERKKILQKRRFISRINTNLRKKLLKKKETKTKLQEIYHRLKGQIPEEDLLFLKKNQK